MTELIMGVNGKFVKCISSYTVSRVLLRFNRELAPRDSLARNLWTEHWDPRSLFQCTSVSSRTSHKGLELLVKKVATKHAKGKSKWLSRCVKRNIRSIRASPRLTLGWDYELIWSANINEPWTHALGADDEAKWKKTLPIDYWFVADANLNTKGTVWRPLIKVIEVPLLTSSWSSDSQKRMKHFRQRSHLLAFFSFSPNICVLAISIVKKGFHGCEEKCHYGIWNVWIGARKCIGQ